MINGSHVLIQVQNIPNISHSLAAVAALLGRDFAYFEHWRKQDFEGTDCLVDFDTEH